MELTVWDSPEDIGLTFTATCQDGLSYPGLRKCGDLKIGDTVSLPFSLSPGEAVSASVQPLTTLNEWSWAIEYSFAHLPLLSSCHAMSIKPRRVALLELALGGIDQPTVSCEERGNTGILSTAPLAKRS